MNDTELITKLILLGWGYTASNLLKGPSNFKTGHYLLVFSKDEYIFIRHEDIHSINSLTMEDTISIDNPAKDLLLFSTDTAFRIIMDNTIND